MATPDRVCKLFAAFPVVHHLRSVGENVVDLLLGHGLQLVQHVHVEQKLTPAVLEGGPWRGKGPHNITVNVHGVPVLRGLEIIT